MDAWVALQNTSNEQLVGLQREFLAHPPLPQQTIQDWIRWRSRVAQGMTELEALSSVLNQSQHPASFPASLAASQSPPPQQPQPQVYLQPVQPQLLLQPVQLAQAQQFNQFDLSTFGTAGLLQQQQQQVYPAYVNMNQVRPMNIQQHPGPSVHAYTQPTPPARPVQNFIAPGLIQQAQQLPLSAPSSLLLPTPTPMASQIPATVVPTPVQQPFTNQGLSAQTSAQPSFKAPPSHLRRPTPPVIRPPQQLVPAAIPQTGTKRQRPALSRRRIMHSPLPPFKDTWIVPVGYDMAKGAAAAARRPDSSRIDDEPLPVDKPAPVASSSTPPPARLSAVHVDVLKALRPEQLVYNKPRQVFKFLRPRPGTDGKLKPDFTPNPTQLADILTKLNAASASYLCVMADDRRYTEVIQRWMKQMAKDPKEWEPAIIPLFRILQRTDMPVNYIIELKIARAAMVIAEKAKEARLPNASQIRVESEKYKKYCTETLLPKNREIRSDSDSSGSDEPANKKRKTEDVKPSVKPAGASSSTSTRPAAKPAARPGAKPGSSNTDMSFFGGASSASSSMAASKPKPKPLPDFKRTPVPPVAPSAGGAGAGSLLASTIRKLGKKEESPPLRTDTKPNPSAQPGAPRADPNKPKPNKKGHLVRWVDLLPSPPPNRPLEAIRPFTQEPHELEPAPWQEEGELHGMSAHDLDKQEGRAMHIHDALEEVVEWHEPSPYLDPATLSGPVVTAEVADQDERERPIMAVSYPAGATPPTPDEAGVRVVKDGESTVSRVLDKTLYAPAPPAPAAAAPVSNVQDLLRNLGGVISQVAQPSASSSYGYDQYGAHQGYGGSSSSSHQQGWQQQQQQQPAAAAPTANRWNNNGAGSGYNAAAGSSYGSASGSNYAGNNNNYGENRTSGFGRGAYTGNRGGAAAGAFNYRKRPCKYYQDGFCKAGNSCTFLH